MIGSLPIDGLLGSIVTALPEGGTVLLQAPPGAGKTTRVPLALLEAFGQVKPGGRGTILMLEPRRLAARAAAERLAESLGEAVGQRVGYRVRLEQRTSAATRIEVVTDGLFLRRLQADPSLEQVACVIFDEFHERRSDADLALALLREARALLAPELRLVVMSATLNLQPLAAQLPEATVIRSEGRSFPVTVEHQPPRDGEPLALQLIRALEHHWLEDRQAGETVLVFLPGQREIHQASRALQEREWGRDLEISPLHGSLPLESQRRSLAPAQGAQGKLVLATSIAESSLTLEGVTLVIDGGLSRRNVFSPRTGMNALVTVEASRASAEQRAGRAGRLGPGRCLRLWSESQHQRRPAFDPPELLEADPAPLVLQLAQWGAGLGLELPWLEPPPLASLQEGQGLLRQLGALEPQGTLTAHGRAMAALGLHPRLSHMLIKGQERGWLDLGCALAVLLSERDPLGPKAGSCDLMLRLDWLSQPGRDPQRRQLQDLQRQLKRQLVKENCKAVIAAANGGAGEREAAARLISWAYPERIALLRPQGEGRYLLSSGQGAWLSPHDPLAGEQALVVAAVDGGGANQEARIHSALALSPELLQELATTAGQWEEGVRWDAAAERVRCEITLKLGALRIEQRPWSEAPETEVLNCLIEALRQRGIQQLPWTSGAHQLQQRLCLAHRLLGEPWPDRTEATLANELDQWLGEHLRGLRTLTELQQLPLEEALWSGLPWGARSELEQLLPSQLTLPSGRTVRLDYISGEPVLAGRLQEFFGSARSPSVLDGRLPVTLHLLSPAGRPVQITRDLARFWQGSYAQVRRELRGRYPKHPWPEDPTNATPSALTKRRLGQAPQD